MNLILVVVLLLTAATGTAVVRTRDPLDQAIVASFHGLVLGIVFTVYQAPDVALSQIADCVEPGSTMHAQMPHGLSS